ncbi:MAG TPA: hypothetical protein VLV16_09930 [Gemmatimonadales bacterium]|nr:hypothetical protein [Gemmatimonadales bacterium]
MKRLTTRRLGLGLGVLAVVLFMLGAFGFWRSSQRIPGDPGISYRSPTTLDKMLARAEQAEKAGDRDAAIGAYRFVVAVGAANDPELEPYIAAARRALVRLGYTPTDSTHTRPAPPP